MRKLLYGLAIIAGLSAFATAVVEAKAFRWAFQADLLSTDPHAVNEPFTVGFLSNVMEPLVRYNRDYKLEPALAVSWELRQATVWRFKLRPNVRFHNGNAFDADDVVFSLKRAMTEGSDYRAALSAVSDIVIVDSHTVDIVLKEPFPVLVNTLPSLLIMDKEWAEANGAARPIDVKTGRNTVPGRTAIGTGPFVLKSREPDVRTTLVPNSAWWDKARHNLTEVVFTPIGNDATRVAALVSGEIDMMFPVPLQNLDQLKKSGKFQVFEGPSERTIYLGMDQSSTELRGSNVKGRNPLKDVRVRRAIYQAIDYDAIREKVMRGFSTPAGLLHAPSLNGFDPALNARLSYDPEASRRLLAEAGYPEGFSMGMDCPNDRYVNDSEICQAVVAMLARVGIKVNLTAQTRSKFFEKIQKRDADFYLMGWATATTKDAHNLLSYVMHTPDGKQGTWNAGGYSNKRVDQLTDLIAFENDPTKRQAMISEAFKIHKDEVGDIPLHQQQLAWVARSGIRLVQTPDDILRLWYVTVD